MAGLQGRGEAYDGKRWPIRNVAQRPGRTYREEPPWGDRLAPPETAPHRSQLGSLMTFRLWCRCRYCCHERQGKLIRYPHLISSSSPILNSSAFPIREPTDRMRKNHTHIYTHSKGELSIRIPTRVSAPFILQFHTLSLTKRKEEKRKKEKQKAQIKTESEKTATKSVIENDGITQTIHCYFITRTFSLLCLLNIPVPFLSPPLSGPLWNSPCYVNLCLDRSMTVSVRPEETLCD